MSTRTILNEYYVANTSRRACFDQVVFITRPIYAIPVCGNNASVERFNTTVYKVSQIGRAIESSLFYLVIFYSSNVCPLFYEEINTSIVPRKYRVRGLSTLKYRLRKTGLRANFRRLIKVIKLQVQTHLSRDNRSYEIAS